MKKKVMVWFSVIAMMALLISGATMAWFTDSKTTTNKFTTGTVTLNLSEVFTSPTTWAPGDETPKDLTFANAGNLPIYVRVKFVPMWNDQNGDDLTPNSLVTSNVTYPLDENWVPITKTVNGVTETWYYCKKLVDPTKDAKLNLKVKLDGPSTGNEYKNKVFTLGVTAEAVQSANFAANDQWNLTPEQAALIGIPTPPAPPAPPAPVIPAN